MAPITNMLSMAVAVVVAIYIIQTNAAVTPSEKATPETIQALGRPFVLGMLYDMRRDELIAGMTLWNRTTIEDSKREKTPQPHKETIVISENNIDSKVNALNINGGLQLSIMAGFVNVQGSAGYLTDTKSSNTNARLTLQYKKTTHFEQLGMELLAKIQYEKILDLDMATHVVTGILYGGSAFFVFDKKVSETENINDITAKMKAKLDKIQYLPVDGKAVHDSSLNETKQVESFSCKYYGDFSLDIYPTTYDEAIHIYRNISTSPDVKAIEVSLTPLSYFQDVSIKLYREISSSLLHRMTPIFEDFNEQTTSCSDLMQEQVCTLFPRIKNQIQYFQKYVLQYKGSIQQKLFSMLPKIRDRSMDEKELVDIVINHENGPFSGSKLKTWLAQKQREIQILKPYVDILKDFEFAHKSGGIESAIANPHYHTVMCFTFKLAGEFDNTLLKLADHLGMPYDGDHHYRPDISWYKNTLAIKRMKTKAQRFKNFAKVNQASSITKYLIIDDILTDINNKQIGAAIILYKDGEVVNDDFEPPSAPEEPTINNIKHNSISFGWNSPVLGYGNIVKYEYICQAVGSDALDWRSVPVTETSVQVSGLQLATLYQIKVRACSIAGHSEALEFKPDNDDVMTRSSSPPGRLSVQRVEATGIYLTWHKPEEKVTNIKHYTVLCKPVNEVIKENWMRHNTQADTDTAYIEGLMPDTKYKFSVIAVCTSGATSAPSEDTPEITTAKLPGIPGLLQPIQQCVDTSYSVQSYPGVSRLVTLSNVQEIVDHVNQLILQGPETVPELRFVVGLCSIVRPTDLPAIFEGVGKLCCGNQYLLVPEPEVVNKKLVIKVFDEQFNKATHLLYTLIADIRTYALSDSVLRRLVSAWHRTLKADVSVEELEATMKHPPIDYQDFNIEYIGLHIHVHSVLMVTALNMLHTMNVNPRSETTTDAILFYLPEMSSLTTLGLAVHTQAQIQRVAGALSTSHLPALSKLQLCGWIEDLPNAPTFEFTQLAQSVRKLPGLRIIELYTLPIHTTAVLEPICDMLQHTSGVTILTMFHCRCPHNVLQSTLIPALRARTSPMQLIWIWWQAGDGTEEDFSQLEADLRPLVVGVLNVEKIP